MKFLAITRQYGDRTMVRLGYQSQNFFFAGEEPKPGAMVCVEPPGLAKDSVDAVINWITEHAGIEKSDRRELDELPRKAWRPAILDDFIDAKHFHSCVYQISRQFTADEMEEFAKRWLPETRAQVQKAIEADAPKLRAKALKKAHPLAERVWMVLAQTPRLLAGEASMILEKIERAKVEEMRAGDVDVEAWLKAAKRFQTGALSQELLAEVSSELVREHASAERVNEVLSKIHGSKKLRELTSWDQNFWTTLLPVLHLDPNVSGETIDISAATEQTVAMSWWVWTARRVGRIVPGRTALVFGQHGKNLTYVRGERKLKFRVTRAGGKLDRFGNTLVVDSTSASMHGALLEVDRLDTLAQVDPKAAVRLLEGRDVPADHPVFEAARAAQDDPRHSRVLADLLIELVVGVDADVARGLARAAARGRR